MVVAVGVAVLGAGEVPVDLGVQVTLEARGVAAADPGVVVAVDLEAAVLRRIGK